MSLAWFLHRKYSHLPSSRRWCAITSQSNHFPPLASPPPSSSHIYWMNCITIVKRILGSSVRTSESVGVCVCVCGGFCFNFEIQLFEVCNEFSVIICMWQLNGKYELKSEGQWQKRTKNGMRENSVGSCVDKIRKLQKCRILFNCTLHFRGYCWFRLFILRWRWWWWPGGGQWSGHQMSQATCRYNYTMSEHTQQSDKGREREIAKRECKIIDLKLAPTRARHEW